jgi:hypothetical protein
MTARRIHPFRPLIAIALVALAACVSAASVRAQSSRFT